MPRGQYSYAHGAPKDRARKRGGGGISCFLNDTSLLLPLLLLGTATPEAEAEGGKRQRKEGKKSILGEAPECLDGNHRTDSGNTNKEVHEKHVVLQTLCICEML